MTYLTSIEPRSWYPWESTTGLPKKKTAQASSPAPLSYNVETLFSENELQAKLSDAWVSRGRDIAKIAGWYVSTGIVELGMIERVKELKSELGG